MRSRNPATEHYIMMHVEASAAALLAQLEEEDAELDASLVRSIEEERATIEAAGGGSRRLCQRRR